MEQQVHEMLPYKRETSRITTTIMAKSNLPYNNKLLVPDKVHWWLRKIKIFIKFLSGRYKNINTQKEKTSNAYPTEMILKMCAEFISLLNDL